MNNFFPPSEKCMMILVDVQERLIKAMNEDKYRHKLVTAVKIMNEMRVPIISTEQYPKGLGKTIPEIKETFTEKSKVFAKTSFPCWGEVEFAKAVTARPEKNLIIVGMESHVCVLQTVLEAIERGYNVIIPADCVCSRSEYDKEIALNLMRDAGATITTIESIAFSWLGDAKNPSFKAISKLIV